MPEGELEPMLISDQDLAESLRLEQVEQERAFYASLTLADRLWLQKAKVGV